MKTTFDPLAQRYPSQRFPIYAREGMVNCSSPQAAAAGLEALRRGGNAMDAAVAAASALTVVEPTANGIGSDAFALVWSEKDKKLFGLNSSGPAPRLATIETVLADGKDDKGKMPTYGWTPVTVPGAPKAWAELSRRFGRMPLSEAMAPAIRYAREGYPCAPNLALMWQRAFKKYKEVCTPSSPSGTGPLPPRTAPTRPGRSSACLTTPTLWSPSPLPGPTLSTRGRSPSRSTQTARGLAATCGTRTWPPTRPNGWSPSRWITGATRSVRSPPTARASRPLWP